MTQIRRKALLLLSLMMALLLALTPALAAGEPEIVLLGDELRLAQQAYDAANADYDDLCARIEELQDRYDNGSEAEQLAVQDALIEALVEEEEAYVALDEAGAALVAVRDEHAGAIKGAELTTHTLKADGYDSKLTITVQVDADGYIWDVQVEVKGDAKDKAVAEDGFLVQFIGRQLPLTTDKKAEDRIVLLSDARVTSQAVVDAINTIRVGGQRASIPEKPDKPLTDPQDIADYIFLYGKLPPNFITKKQAQNLGWDSSWNYVSDVAPGKSIGGDRFGNYEGLLPEKKGRQWYEADCYYTKGKRNAHRILFSNDGLVYYTDDHYESFTQMFPSWE